MRAKISQIPLVPVRGTFLKVWRERLHVRPYVLTPGGVHRAGHLCLDRGADRAAPSGDLPLWAPAAGAEHPDPGEAEVDKERWGLLDWAHRIPWMVYAS
jgi:hypothetical protein